MQNEEIKEILFKVKKENKYENILWDYITNLQEENQKLRKKIKYMEMIMEYKNELRQPQDESEIHNELYRIEKLENGKWHIEGKDGKLIMLKNKIDELIDEINSIKEK